MRILLTGSTGLIGSAVYAALAADHEVIRLGRSFGNYDFQLDLANPTGEPLPQCDTLIHCAGVVDEDFSGGSASRLPLIAIGADYLTSAATRAGARRGVYVSSSHVYGVQEGSIDECARVNPLSYYAITHFCTEQLFKKAFSRGGQSTLILRPNAVFGPLPNITSFKRWSLIPFSFPLEAWAHHRIVLKSPGVQRRNFVSAMAIGRLIYRWLAEPDQQTSQIVHPIGNVTESVYEFAQRCSRVVSAVTQAECPLTRPAEMHQGMAQFDYMSTSPPQEDSLDDHVRYMVELFSANQTWAKDKSSTMFS